jgi:ribonuclease HI
VTSTPTIVYTDGACQGNPGPGGWAWAVPDGAFRAGASHATTNQRMELLAALDAVTTLRGPVRVISDSTYVVNCFRDGWWEGWLRKGWKNSQKKDVANRDLWEPLIDEYRAEPGRLTFEWVKGHSGDRMNDLVDRLAVEAADRQEGRSGTGTPLDLGPPDRPGRPGRALWAASVDPAGVATGDPTGGPVAAGRLATGHRVLVTGLRPPDLGGWEENLVVASVRRRLSEVLAAKAGMAADLVVTTGLGLGTEQVAAEAARDADVPYVAVLAYPIQDRLWSAASRARFASLLAGATDVVIVDPDPPADKQGAGRALGRRDDWLAGHADEAIVVWDGKDEIVGRNLKALERRLGDEQIWVLSP